MISDALRAVILGVVEGLTADGAAEMAAIVAKR